MGNANGREEGESGSGSDDPSVRSDGNVNGGGGGRGRRADTVESMENSPPGSPARSCSPLMFAPQIPVAPLPRVADNSVFNNPWGNDSGGSLDFSPGKGIPTMITWNYGGHNVAVEGSWDNWKSRRILQRSGKDHSILLVLSSGVYRYKFIVDGECRYTPDLPCVADDTGHVLNLLDVHDYAPENLDTVTEFEAPPSPDWSYSQSYPLDEDFAKEPPMAPPQAHLTVLEAQDELTPVRPQHAVLNHLFIEKGWGSQSLLALGLTHRFQSKYVTVVLYKPLRR
ncbi:hypothetical protein Taro_027734 [Colocasia esculenta]|uniref:Association with the SNF1 complex (ASC) domain-containing protein n=1 Tax=Colocasia esculenta TaxID=4460 RepID=A0A843VSB6_COLES|nr:hypothetical protein [Colocasia esculenta]